MTRSQTRLLAGFIAAVMVAFAIGALLVIFVDTSPACVQAGPSTSSRRSFEAPPCPFIDPDIPWAVTMQTSMGPIRFIADPRLAKTTVNNFVFLARQRFFDGTTVHRIENASDHAVVQFGDPTGTGRGGPGYEYEPETPSPITEYIRGVVALALNRETGRAGSQFFIVVRDWKAIGPPNATPRATFFGIVPEFDPESFETLDRISRVPTRGTDPIQDVVVRSVRVELIEDPEGPGE